MRSLRNIIKTTDIPSLPPNIWSLEKDPEDGTPRLLVNGECVLCISRDEERAYIGNSTQWEKFGLKRN